MNEEVREILQRYGNFMTGYDADGDVIDIDEATTQICQLKDREYQERTKKMAEHIAKRTGQLTQAKIECQQKIKQARQEMVEEIAGDLTRRGQAGIDALPEGEQGFWKGYWQALIDKGQELKSDKPPVNPVGCGGDS